MSEKEFFCKTSPKTDTQYNTIIEALVSSIKGLSRQVFYAYNPIVDDICSRKSVSAKELEPILDGLLSVCISDEIFSIIHKIPPTREEDIEYDLYEGDTSDYWLSTAANAIKPLHQLIALAKMRPNCIWDGD